MSALEVDSVKPFGMRGPLSRNIAEVIDDLYRQHAPPRNHERMIELVQHQIERAMLMERKRILAIADDRLGQKPPR